MTAECLGETGMSQIDHSQGKRVRGVTRGRDHTQEEESHNWKTF